MQASGTTTVKAGETEANITIEIDKMPEYFYLRVFLVDSETLKPLTSAYASPNYTQEMQVFLSKTSEDFEEERVLNLDKDTTTNFLVYNEKTVIIPQSSKKNQLVESNEETEEYIFKNVDSNMTSLQSGDIFSYTLEDSSQLIVKIADVEINGTTITIKGEDTSLEEIFDYVKIDTMAITEDATVDSSTCDDGVICNGIVESESKSNQKTQSFSSKQKEVIADAGQVDAIDKTLSQSQTLSYSFANVKIAGDDSENVKLSGTADLKNEVSVKVYISLSYQYLELKMNYGLNLDISISGKSQDEVELGTLGFSPVPGVIIEVAPKFVVEVNAQINFNGALTGTIGFAVSSDEGMKNLTSNPEVESSLKTEGTIFVGLSMEPRIVIINDELVKVGLKAKIGGELNAKVVLWETGTPSKIHACNKCLDGDIFAKFTLEFEAKLFNSDDLKYNYKITDQSTKILDYYHSYDREQEAWTECPYIEYKVNVTVKDTDGNVLNDVSVQAPFCIVDEDGAVKEVEEIKTNEKGKAEGYLPNGEYTLQIEKEGYQKIEKKITVQDGTKKIEVELKKETAGNIESVINNTTLSINGGLNGVVTKDGSLYMWGYNYAGQLGDGSTIDSAEPKKIMENVIAVSVGDKHSGAITKDGSLYMWGSNEYGQLGDGTTIDSKTPKKIMENVVFINLGDSYSGAITKDGSLYMWGYNDDGQLGTGNTNDSSEPQKIMENVVSVSVGMYHSGAVTKDGSLYMWGNNSSGQLGSGNTNASRKPQKIMENIVSVSVGTFHSGAVTKDGSLYMWGSNEYGQLGDGSENDSLVPKKIMKNIVALGLENGHHSGAITKDGSLYMWGFNRWAQLGDGSRKYSAKPKKIMEDVVSVSLGGYGSGAVTKDGSLYMWGDGSLGVLWEGHATENETPIKIMDNIMLPIQQQTTLQNLSFKTQATQTKTYLSTMLKPNTEYTFFAVKSKETQNILASSNLLYINQVVSDSSGKIWFNYGLKEDYEDWESFLGGELSDTTGKQDEDAVSQTTTPKIYTVTFNANGGTALGCYKKYIGENTKIESLPTVKLINYTFKGWYTKKTGGTKVKKTTIIKQDCTLYAQWAKTKKPGKAKKLSLKRGKGGQIVASYKKISGVKGYEIVYSTNKKFKTGTTKKVTTTALKKSLSKLKKKKYYVKVRAYNVDSTGKKFYGSYSTVKSIKVK